MSYQRRNCRSFFCSLTFLAVSFLCWWQPPAQAAQNVTVAWDASYDLDVAGYKLYFGQEHLKHDSCVDAGNATSATISLPVAGATYYLAATTYDTAGNESDFSGEVVINPPGTTTLPSVLTLAAGVNKVMSVSVAGVNGAQYVVEASTNLSNWVALQTNIAPFTYTDTNAAKFAQRYYRSYAL
jgi:hypothetical protein